MPRPGFCYSLKSVLSNGDDVEMRLTFEYTPISEGASIRRRQRKSKG